MKRDGHLRQDLRSAVLDRILMGGLVGGQKINESRLSVELGVSRTPLREALLYLEREGFARSTPRRGFSVEPTSSRHVSDIYPIVWTLEGLALRTVAEVPQLLLPDLKSINSKLAQAHSPKRALELDTEWHETLVGQCQNEHLLRILANLRLSIRRYEYLFFSKDSRLIPTSVAQHRAVLAALEKGSVNAAVRALENNWRFGMRVLLMKIGAGESR